MRIWPTPLAAILSGLLALAPLTPAVGADAAPVLTGPVLHGNLAVYLVHGPSTAGPVPLSLEEGLTKGSITLSETGDVNELTIENTGSEPVFIQAGDIVKGGQQDRVVSVSMVLAPKSGARPIGAFCVESGRWSARGSEDATKFESSALAIPSRDAKIAMLAPSKTAAAATSSEDSSSVEGNAQDVSTRQGEVWRLVAETQSKLSAMLAKPVAAAESETSLQLALENEAVSKARAGYVDALEKTGLELDDVIGAAFAINGRITSIDVYASNALFRKMWPKLLNAGATEAMGEAAQDPGTAPERKTVEAFFSAAEDNPASQKRIDEGNIVEMRDSETMLYLSTRDANGTAVHSSYLSK